MPQADDLKNRKLISSELEDGKATAKVTGCLGSLLKLSSNPINGYSSTCLQWGRGGTVPFLPCANSLWTLFSCSYLPVFGYTPIYLLPHTTMWRVATSAYELSSCDNCFRNNSSKGQKVCCPEICWSPFSTLMQRTQFGTWIIILSNTVNWVYFCSGLGEFLYQDPYYP